MPDRGFTILSTGSAGLNESRITDKTHPGSLRSVTFEEIPFIKIVLNTDAETRDQILFYAGKSIEVIFTSANAVRAVVSVLQDKPDWKIYCVGSETRKRAALFFGASAIMDQAGNAEGLAGKIILQKPKELIFFCGDQRRETLTEKLEESGIGLQEVIVYQTQLTPVKLTKSYDAILFFSPTAVASFFSMNNPSTQTILFALGSTTASALKNAGKNEVVISAKPDKEFLLQMAVAYGHTHPIT
jgi:uroporphyrinogen-III synthase